MKIKAFLTDKSVHMQSVPVFATDETMPGALRLTPTGKEFDDFSGFGVCLTGGDNGLSGYLFLLEAFYPCGRLYGS